MIRLLGNHIRRHFGRDSARELPLKPSFQRTKCSVDFFDLTFPVPYIERGTERWLRPQPSTVPVPDRLVGSGCLRRSRPALARPCSSAASWRAAAERQRRHPRCLCWRVPERAFSGVTCDPWIESLDYLARNTIDYRAHSQALACELSCSSPFSAERFFIVHGPTLRRSLELCDSWMAIDPSDIAPKNQAALERIAKDRQRLAHQDGDLQLPSLTRQPTAEKPFSCIDFDVDYSNVVH